MSEPPVVEDQVQRTVSDITETEVESEVDQDMEYNPPEVAGPRVTPN